MSEFLPPPLQVEEVDADRWRLLTILSYNSDLLGRIHSVEAGTITDLESIPRLVPFAYAVAKGRAKRPAVIHDDLYQTPGFPKKMADDVFYEAMLSINLGHALAWLMWLSVHWFGHPNYHRLQARALARLKEGAP